MSLLLRFLGIEELDSLPPERASFFAAFAYVLARVAGADLRMEDAERAEIKKQLVRVAGISETEAELVAAIAEAHVDELGGTENYVVTREFRRISSREERLRLLDCLYSVAAADDLITGDESNEVMNIALELGLERDEALAARSKFRDKLAALRKLPGEQR